MRSLWPQPAAPTQLLDQRLILPATPPNGGGLLSLELGPGVDGFVGPVLQVTDQRLNVVQRMKNITAAGTPRQSLLVPGAEPRGEIGDGGLGSEAPVDQFQQPDAPSIGVAMLFQTQQEAEGRGGIDPTKTGSPAWKISSRRPTRMLERSYCGLILWA